MPTTQQQFVDRFTGADADPWTDTTSYKRFYMPSGDTSRVTTPDHADYAPPGTTTNWDLRGELTIRSGVNQTVLSQWGSSQNGFVLAHGHAGQGSIRLYWSTTGSDTLSTTNTGGNFTADVGDRVQIRVLFLQDNGASGYDSDFYYKINSTDDLDSDTGWTQLGTTVTGGATTTVHNSTNTLEAGRYSAGASDQNEIDVFQVCIKSGTTTKLYADFRSGTWEPTGDDEQGHTWTPQTQAVHEADESFWTVETAGSSAVNIQGTEGRLAQVGAVADYARAYTQTIGKTLDVYCRAARSSALSGFRIGFQKNADWNATTPVNPQDGYMLYLNGDNTQPALAKAVSDSWAEISSFGSSPGTTDYWYRLQYDGATLRAKQWTGDKTDEPVAWGVTSTQTQLSGDEFRVFVGADDDSTDIDDVEVSKLGGFFSSVDWETADIEASDSTALDVTGDIDIIALAMPFTANQQTGLIGKGVATGDQRSYYFKTNAGTTRPVLRFGWSTDGTLANQTFTSSTAELPADWNVNDFLWVRVTLDVDNGASGYDLKFWWSADSTDTDPTAVSWTQLGTTITGGATTSINNGTAPATAGFTQWDTGNDFNGRIAYAGIYNGIGGTLAGEIDFRDDDESQTDSASNSWSQSGTGGLWAPTLSPEIKLIGNPQSGSASNGADVTLTFDGDVQEGDVVLVLGGTGTDSGTDPLGPSTSGYTEESTQYDSTPPFEYGVWWKVMGATPDTTVVCQGSDGTADATAYIAYVLRGVNQTIPIDTASVYGTTSVTATPDPPAITAPSDGAMVFAWSVVDGAVSLSSQSAGYQAVAEASGSDTNRIKAVAAFKTVLTTRVENPGTFTYSGSSDANGISVAIRPASGASGTPFTIDPDGDGTITGIFTELAAVTNLYQSVDDDPDSPTLTDWNTSGEADGNTFYTLGAVPADFDTINTPLTIRAYVGSTDFGSDTAILYAQVFAANETTAYTNEVQVTTQAGSGLVTADMTVNATGLAANKAAWDAARIKLRWDYTA